MKNLTFCFLLCLGLIVQSCKKSEGNSDALYGKWKLKESYSDPGNGSGRYQAVNEELFLNFEQSGKVSGEAVPELSTFKVKDSTTIEFTTKASDVPVLYHFKIEDNQLTLNPPCIEGCGLRFIKQ